MANIVQLREMSGEKLAEMLENAREEMFNLRFQNASARLEDYSRLKIVRKEIAQLETVLHLRSMAKDAAVEIPEIISALDGENWTSTARFQYEDSGWLVTFSDENGSELASALVDLNKAKPSSRKSRFTKTQPQLVVRYEIAG